MNSDNWHKALKDFLAKSQAAEEFDKDMLWKIRFNMSKASEVECTCDIKLLFDQGCKCDYVKHKLSLKKINNDE